MKGPITKLVIVGAAVLLAGWLAYAEPFVLPGSLPEGMPVAAPQRCLGVFAVCMSLWFTSLIPHAATGLLAIALLPLLGIMPEDQALSLFGNRAVFFMLGVFLLAGAMISTGLSKRLTLIALHSFDRTPDRLINGVMLSAAFMSLWMPAYGVAAMIYPIVVEIVDALELKRGSPYAKKLFLALAWGAVIGACGTILGGARAPLALSLLHETYPGKSISFLQWMAASMPVVVIMLGIALITLHARIANDLDDIKAATSMLDRRVQRLGPMSPKERRLSLLGFVTIFAWIVWGETVGLAVIAMLSAVALFLFRIADWNSVRGYVNWGVLIMYGGAVALGKALTDTQAMAWLCGRIISPEAPRLLVVLLVVAAAIMLTEMISNAAAVAVLLPVAFTLGEVTGVGPVLMTFAVTVPAGMAFLFPVSSPPNAISFAAGHYTVREVVRVGWTMSIAGLVVLSVIMLVWWEAVLDVGSW